MPVGAEPMLERLRRLLHPRYEVERELASEEFATLFLAHDTALKRAVAVKVLLPEAQGDAVSRRFLREARILARLTHPNIVAIHESEESDGLTYYVRDYLDGQPFSTRLARGRLPEREAVHVAQDLLAALGAAHRSGVIHRAVHPANICCLSDRAVLMDFGLATRASDSTDPGSDRLTDLSYAAPEQVRGGQATARADLYSVGAVLYHALSGRRWVSGTPPARARWSGVPRRLRGPLRRALAPVPAERWSDAESFGEALRESDLEEPGGRPVAYGSVLLLTVAAVAVWAWPTPPRAGPPPKELAIVPFEAGSGGEREGADLAHLIQLNLSGLPGLSLTPPRHVTQWWDDHGRTLVGTNKAAAASQLRVHWLGHGQLEHIGDSVHARLTLYNPAGHRTPIAELRFGAGDLGPLSDSLAVLVVRAIAPQLAGSYRVVGDLAEVRLAALGQFLRGEGAFQQDAWATAEHRYAAALDLDSSFALAAWRLANVKRWRRLPYENDLRSLSARHGSRLRPLDRALIAALLEPDLGIRLGQLDSVVARFPDDAYTRLLFADELFHRGPLVGRASEEGASAMAHAVARDSLLALAYDHLILDAIRGGDRGRARQMIKLRSRASSASSTGDPDVLGLMKLAYDERFLPWRAGVKRWYLNVAADSAQIEGLTRLFRTGVSWFDIPESQLALGGFLLRSGPADSAARGSAHLGRAIALMALGRAGLALGSLDSAASLLDSDEARLEQAEWRMILPTLGLPLPGDGGEWRARLMTLSTDKRLGPRAAWALAFAAGDTLETHHWWDALRKEGGHARELERVTSAMVSASRGAWREALAASDSVSVFLNATTPPDPFARAVFHLERSGWLLAAGDTVAAERELRWYENSDVEGWPSGVSQAGELDGMLGVYGRLLRSRILLRRGASEAERQVGCALAGRVAELWSGADSAFQSLIRNADRPRERCPS